MRKIFTHDASLIAIAVLIIAAAFAPALRGQFVNFDDDVHVYENPQIRSLAPDNIGRIFSSVVNKTYIPLTTLSYAVEYYFAGLNPFVFHLDNLLLHLAVVGMIFLLARRL